MNFKVILVYKQLIYLKSDVSDFMIDKIIHIYIEQLNLSEDS